MTLDEIRALITDDIAAVDELIKSRLNSQVALISQLGAYIVNGGGKRLRPIITLLAARACGYEGRNHIQLAATVAVVSSGSARTRPSRAKSASLPGWGKIEMSGGLPAASCTLISASQSAEPV